MRKSKVTIKRYKPGIIVLFDKKKNKTLRGSLILNVKKASPTYPTQSVKPVNYSFLALAAFFFFGALWGLINLFLPLVLAHINSEINKKTPAVIDSIPKTTFPPYAKESIIVEPFKDNSFKIQIPKIGLESDVIMDVDPANEYQYKEQLKFGVAHAKGSYFPGENGPVYLFSHSTDTIANIANFNAKFFAVKELEAGDEIDIYFRGKKYRYSVNRKEIISPTDIDKIRQSKDDLILQTCYPPGTDWQRLILYADIIPD